MMEATHELFKNYLGKIGSGQNTSKGLTREESGNALKLILKAQASPAQIGAFLIAHRIRRPEPQELAGMLDTYLELGPKILSQGQQRRPICFGMPFDGRTRTAPIYPLTTLLLIASGQPVVLQGGKRMPTKFGVTSIELFSALGIHLEGLSITELQNKFSNNGLALIHQPDHFPLAESLIPYRQDLGKRTPLSTMELIWTAHQGNHLIISGFVHSPTEEMCLETLRIRKEKEMIFVKGLEGGVDLSTNRAFIAGHFKENEFQRLIIHPQDYINPEENITWSNIEEWQKQALLAIENKGPLLNQIIWNAGIYLFLSNVTTNIEDSIRKAENCISSGLLKDCIQKLMD